MRVIERTISYRTRSDEFTIYPLSDIHFGSVACDEARLDTALDEIAADPRALYLLLGDQFDSINPMDKRFSVSALPAWLADEYRQDHGVCDPQRNELLRRIKSRKRLAGRCIGVVEGNHEQKVMHDFGIDMYHQFETALRVNEAERLDLGMSGFVVLRFQQVTPGSETPGHVYTLTMYVTHGFGGGDLAGGVALKLERELARFESDITLMGHVHKVQIIPRARPIRVNANLQLEQPPDVVGAYCGSFMKSRVQDVTTYPESKGMSPSASSSVLIRVRPFSRTFEVVEKPALSSTLLA